MSLLLLLYCLTSIAESVYRATCPPVAKFSLLTTRAAVGATARKCQPTVAPVLIGLMCLCVFSCLVISAGGFSFSQQSGITKKEKKVSSRCVRRRNIPYDKMKCLRLLPGFKLSLVFFFFFSSDVYRLYIRITKKRNLDRQSLLLPPTMYIHQQKELLQSNKSCALVYMLDRRKIGLLLRKLKGIFSFFLSFFGGNYGCAGKRQSNTTISAALCN